MFWSCKNNPGWLEETILKPQKTSGIVYQVEKKTQPKTPKKPKSLKTGLNLCFSLCCISSSCHFPLMVDLVRVLPQN